MSRSSIATLLIVFAATTMWLATFVFHSVEDGCSTFPAARHSRCIRGDGDLFHRCEAGFLGRLCDCFRDNDIAVRRPIYSAIQLAFAVLHGFSCETR
jgi:hypothetical protein